MMTEGILFNFGRNMVFLREKTDGLTQAESVLQPPFPGLNCLNWQVGHIASFRNRLLQLLGEEPTLDPAIAQRYAAGSDPVLGDEPGIGQLDDLLRAIGEAQERLIAALPKLAPERAAEVLSAGQFSMTVGEWVMFYMRHEGYHIGQLHAPHAQAIAARGGA
jgi:uncharacterized damage-inducible protein DinB